MTTRADIRTRTRDELNDNGAVTVWSDTLLNRWIGEAIREWSRVVPRDRTWQTTSTANDPSYVLPSDVLEVVRVDLLRRLLGRRVGAQVADRHLGRAEVGEAQRDLPTDPARAARDEGGLALEDRH